TGAHRRDAALDAEIGQHRFQHAGILFQRLVREAVIVGHLRRFGEKAQRRKLVFAGCEIERRLLGGLAGLGRALGFVALDPAFAPLRQAGGSQRLGTFTAVAGVQMITFLAVVILEFGLVHLLVVRQV